MLAILAASGVLLWSLQSFLQNELDLLATQLRIRKFKAARMIQRRWVASRNTLASRRQWRGRYDPTSVRWVELQLGIGIIGLATTTILHSLWYVSRGLRAWPA